MLCVWQYSVVLPGSCLEMCKSRVSRTGLRLLVTPRCSTCPHRLSPSCPSPSCYAMTSASSRPRSLYPIRHPKALQSVSMQKTRGWSIPNLFGILKACIPDPFSHLAAWTLLKLKPKHFHWSAFAPLCADCTSVQLNLRVGELKIQSVKCSSPRLSFWLWEQRLTFKGHVHNLNTDLMPNKPNWKETGQYHPALIVAYCKRQGPVWHSGMLWSANLLHSTCSLWGGALIHWVEGTAGQREQTHGANTASCRDVYMLLRGHPHRKKSLLSCGFQFATVHSWSWVIPGTYFFKTKNEIAF